MNRNGKILFTDGFRLQLFSNRETAESKACEISNNYYIVQVISHSIMSSEKPYVTVNEE